jgi:hypothetical protein
MTPLSVRYLVVQPYGPEPRQATVIESFAAIEDAYEALDRLAERLHNQGADPESFGFRVTDHTFRAVERPRLTVQ